MKTVLSLASPLRQQFRRVRARLSRILALIAWRYLLRSQRYIRLHDLVLETEDGPVALGLVVLSTRGVFVVETWDANITATESSSDRFERGRNAASGYQDAMRSGEQRARVVARVLGEDQRLVSPVIVSTGPCLLPEQRPSNLVSDFGLVQYIRSFKVNVYSCREIQEIESRLVRPRSLPSRRAA